MHVKSLRSRPWNADVLTGLTQVRPDRRRNARQKLSGAVQKWFESLEERRLLTVDLTTAEDLAVTSPPFSSIERLVMEDEQVHGTAVINSAAKTVTYTPETNYFNTQDSRAYFDVVTGHDGQGKDIMERVYVLVTPVNDAPVVAVAPMTTPEDTPLNIVGVSVSDVDAGTAAITATVSVTGGTLQVTVPQNFPISPTGNGTSAVTMIGSQENINTLLASLKYTPASNRDADDTLKVEVNDGGNGPVADPPDIKSTTRTATIDIVPVNDAPTAANDEYNVNEDDVLTIPKPGVLLNDTDPDSPLTAQLTTLPLHGSLVFNIDGSFTYTPAKDYFGDDSFAYTARDDKGLENGATVTIHVTPVNDAPVGKEDAYTVSEDGQLKADGKEGRPAGVLANDVDVDKDSAGLSAALVSGPSHGTLTFNADGTFIYTPTANYNGPDSFTYKASDGTMQSAETTVKITVSPANDPPSAIDDVYSMNEDAGPLVVNTAAGILSNDPADPDGDALSVTLATPAQGAVALAPDGSFTYTPPTNFFGDDGFGYILNDGHGGTATAWVTIHVLPVNDPATLSVPGDQTVSEDVEKEIKGIVVADQPNEGNLTVTLTVTKGTLRTYKVVDGKIVVDQEGASFSITGTPADVNAKLDTLKYQGNSNYNGADTLKVALDDLDGTTLSKDVKITVTAVNDAPVLTVPASTDKAPITVAEDGELILTGMAVADVDAGDKPIVITLSVANGKISVPTHASLTITGNNSPNVSITGKLGDIQARVFAVNGVKYKPTADYNGSDLMTVGANDQGNQGSGGAGTDSELIYLDVTEVNDAPIGANDGPYIILEDASAQTLNVLANDQAGPANESTQKLKIIGLGSVLPPEVGVVSIAADGLSLTFTPGPNFNTWTTGQDVPLKFRYVFTDDGKTNGVAAPLTAEAEISITVRPNNDKPIASDNFVDTKDVRGTGLVIDEDAKTLINLGNYVTDPETADANLTYTIVAWPANGTLEQAKDSKGNILNGQFWFTPNADWHGAADKPTGETFFTWYATDRGDPDGTNANPSQLSSDTKTFRITVNAKNDAPVALDGSAATAEQVPVTIDLRPLVSDVETSDENLDYRIDVSPTHGSLDPVPGQKGKYIYTPNLGGAGGDWFRFSVVDRGDPDGTVFPGDSSRSATFTINITALNDKPEASNNFSSDTDPGKPVDEDSPGAEIYLGDFASDVETADGNLNYQIVTQTSHGTLTPKLDADKKIIPGWYIYKPAANFNGRDQFTWAVTDRGDPDNNPADPTYSPPLTSNTATFRITVLSINDAPVAQNDAYSVQEDSTLTITAAQGVLANDSDPNDSPANTPFKAILAEAPASGTLVFNDDGSFTYAPAANFNGMVAFKYWTVDSGGMRSDSDAATVGDQPATVTIQVGSVNDAPTATNDSYTTDEDIPLERKVTYDKDGKIISNEGVLANDTDNPGSPGEDNLPLTAQQALSYKDDKGKDIPLGPFHGTVQLNPDGSFIYTPDPNWNSGPNDQVKDQFAYYAVDSLGGKSANYAVVTLTVKSVNDKPIAGNDSYSTEEDKALTKSAAEGVLRNDFDGDGSTIQAFMLTGPLHGTATLSADGAFTYTPVANYHGPDSFTYRVFDGTDYSDPATVRIDVISVNDLPIANADSYSTNEDTLLHLPILDKDGNIIKDGVKANDSDPDGDATTVIIVTWPANGTLSPDPVTGRFDYMPKLDFNGSDFFEYQLSDGTGLSAKAKVTIGVAAVNDAPVLTVPGAQSIDEDLVLTMTGFAVSDVDADAKMDPIVVFLSAAHGMITLAPPILGTTIVGSGTDSVSITGTIENINKILSQGVKYQSALNYNGPDTITVRADDRGFSGAGGAKTDLKTIAVTVNSVDDGIAARFPTLLTAEDTDLMMYQVKGQSGNAVSLYDVDGAASVVTVTLSVTHGTLTLKRTDGLTAVGNGTNSITLTGDLATMNLRLGNDTTIADGKPQDWLKYDPEDNFRTSPAGKEILTIVGQDGSAGTSTSSAEIVVTPVNDKPAAQDGTSAVDEDGQTLIDLRTLVTDETAPDKLHYAVSYLEGLTPTATNGIYLYKAAPNFNGTAQFTFWATDDGDLPGSSPNGGLTSDPKVVKITVASVNDAPVAVNDAFTTNEDETLTRKVTYKDGKILLDEGVLANDTDWPGAPGENNLPLKIGTLVEGAKHGSLILSPDGSFTYTPDHDFYGTDTFKYKAMDSLGAISDNVATVTITVVSVNDAPRAGDDGYQTLEDRSLTVAAPGVLANDSDPENNLPLSGAVNVSQPAHGSVTMNVDGSFVYTPNANFNGIDTFTYSVYDSLGAMSTATVAISVLPVNDEPVAREDTYTTNEDTALTADGQDKRPAGVLANDGDPADSPANNLIATLLLPAAGKPNPGPFHGTVVWNTNGTFTYTPERNWNGTDTFQYKISDDGGTANGGDDTGNTVTVTINVLSVNDAPQANNDSFTIAEDGLLSNTVISNDKDEHFLADGKTPAVGEGNSLVEVKKTADPLHGTLILNADGTFTYRPNLNFNGADSFKYKVRDSGGTANGGTDWSNEATVSITVSPVDDAPIAISTILSTDEDTVLVYDASKPALATDPDNNALTYRVVTAPAHGKLALDAANGTFTYTPDANWVGQDFFTFKANDGTVGGGDSNLGQVVINVTERNDPPTVKGETINVNEDTSVSGNVLANDTDPEGNTPLRARIIQGVSHGTLTLSNLISDPNSPWNGTFNGNFSYTPAANFSGDDSFTYVVIDSLGAVSGEVTATIKVANINDAPVLAPIAAQTVNEGDLVTFTASATDVDGGTLTYSLINAPAGATIDPVTGAFTWVATDDGTYSFDVRAADNGSPSLSAVQGVTITVRNVAPVLNLGPEVNVGTGLSFTRVGSFIDPGTDTWTATVDYGDGSGVQPLILKADKTFTLTHVYTAPAQYTATVVLTDDNGGKGTATLKVNVNTHFQVADVTPTASGVEVRFNRQANVALLNLYDGVDATVDAADLTLVGAASGPIRGSLLWDPATNTAKFVKSGAPLASDTYTLTLASRTDGWVATDGELLDGDLNSVPGGDYVTTFTVTAPPVVLSIPDFARAPNQPVNIPATAGGIPVRISNAEGASAIQFEVAYDPALLTISGATLAPGMPSGWMVTANTMTPGLAIVAVFAGTSDVTVLPAGARQIVSLTASVPSAAPWNATQVIRVRSVKINEDPVQVASDDAVQLVALLGDATGNRAYSALDASYIAGVSVGPTTGFDAFGMVDPVIVADVTGNGDLSSLDAAKVAQKSVDIPVPEIPDVPAAAPAAPLAATVVAAPAALGRKITPAQRMRLEKIVAAVDRRAFRAFNAFSQVRHPSLVTDLLAGRAFSRSPLAFSADKLIVSDILN